MQMRPGARGRPLFATHAFPLPQSKQSFICTDLQSSTEPANHVLSLKPNGPNKYTIFFFQTKTLLQNETLLTVVRRAGGRTVEGNSRNKGYVFVKCRARRGTLDLVPVDFGEIVRRGQERIGHTIRETETM